MSYRCPKCEGTIYDRTNYVCPVCGADLPPELLFRPPDMPDFDKVAEGKEIQVALLSQALLELRKARGHPQATRQAVIRYFKTGISYGFEIDPLLKWLFSWPSDRWSVFSQVDFSAKAGREFVEMLEKMTIQDLDLNDTSARMPSNTPGEIEVYSFYRKHLGPRMEAAGLRVQFHYNQKPGIHFKVQPREEYRRAIIKGIEEGMAARFPDFPSTGSIWITEISEHEVDSCERAFYRAGRLVIDQAYSLTQSAQA